MSTELIVILLCSIVVITATVLLIVYIKESEAINEEYKNHIVKNGVNSFNLTFNVGSKKITTYKEGKIIDTYTYENVLNRKYRIAVNDWIRKLQSNKDAPLIVRSSISNKLFEIKLEDFKDHIYYAIANYIDDDYEEKLNNDKKETFLDFQNLKNFLSNLKRRRFSFIMIIRFDLYNTILSRYGEEVANVYLKQLYYLMKRTTNFKNNEFMCLYDEDSFVFYKQGYLPLIGIKSFAKRKLDELSSIINVGPYQFEIKPKIGVCEIFNVSKDLKQYIEDAYNVCDFSNSNERIFICDDAFYKKKTAIKEQELKNSKIFNDFVNNVGFNEIVSFAGGEQIGYFPVITKDKEKIFNELCEYYSENNRLDYFINNVYYKTFAKYKEKKYDKKLFILAKYEYVTLINQILIENKEFSDLDIVVNILDYDSLLKDIETRKKELATLLKSNISLGIVGSETISIKFSGLLHMFKWLILQNSLLESTNDKKGYIIVKGIIDSVERLDLNIVGYNVSKYDTAKILKDLGADYISGPILFTDKDEYNSLREISKLIEERG